MPTTSKRRIKVAGVALRLIPFAIVVGLVSLAGGACSVSTSPKGDDAGTSTLSNTAVAQAATDTCKRNGFKDVGDNTLQGTCITAKNTCQVRDIGANVVCYGLTAADRANGIDARCTATFNYIRRIQLSGAWQEWVDIGNDSVLGWDLQERSGQWEATLQGLAAAVPYQPLESVTDSICR